MAFQTKLSSISRSTHNVDAGQLGHYHAAYNVAAMFVQPAQCGGSGVHNSVCCRFAADSAKAGIAVRGRSPLLVIAGPNLPLNRTVVISVRGFEQ